MLLGSPRDASAARSQLRSRLEHIVSNNLASPFSTTGAVFAVTTPGDDVVTAALGCDARGVAICDDSLMHLASASKLATSLLILRLIEGGAMTEESEIGAYLPDARCAGNAGITIRRMLSHTSGLPLELRHELSYPSGDFRLREGIHWPGELARACLASDVVHAPGTVVQYSNIAFGLLGLAAERVTGRSFAEQVTELVFEPLSIRAYLGRPAANHIIAVADVPSPYVGTELEPYNAATSREWGVPWAGVITDAAGLLKLVRSYDQGSGFLSSELAGRATSNQTQGLEGGFKSTDPFIAHYASRPIQWSFCAWGLGIELQGGKRPHWAPPDMPASFGQIGSSGCIGWHDPASGVTWAVLGARTTESGWLVRHGARIAQTALRAAQMIETDPMPNQVQEPAAGRHA